METELVKDKSDDIKKGEKSSSDDKEEYDIVASLELTGHSTTRYPNGLTLGVKLESIPSTRGVHVDIVFVLDLREAAFGKGGLAMRAAVLETVNRNLDRVLDDVGASKFVEKHMILTPFVKLRLPLMRGEAKGSLSLMHETRTIYVITETAKPTTDLTWLTDSGRIVTADQFALIRQSDARSRLPELKKNIMSNKWNLLEKGITHGWFGILALLAFIIGISSLSMVLLAKSGSILLPMIASAVSGVICGLFLRSSRKSVSNFVNMMMMEQESLKEVGDSTRISNSIQENEERLHLIGDLSFVVSPLIAATNTTIEKNDVNATVNIACSVLDECVRLSPIESESKTLLMGDLGLRKFIGLFEHLGGYAEEEKLALAYVGLTGHLTRSLDFGETVAYLTELVNALYDIGALRPDIKESVDDHLNQRSLEATLQEFDKELDTDDAQLTTIPEIVPEPVAGMSEETPVENAVDSPVEDELSDLILHASVDKSETTKTDDSDDSISVVAADIIAGQQKMKNKPKDIAQLSLLNHFELSKSDGDASKESGSTGV